MKIANIVSINKINVSDEFNVVETMGDIIHGLPTLIVGIEIVIENYPDFNILNFEIEPNIYWTFRRTEKRDKFDEDFKFFIRKVYDVLTKDLSYVFVDPIQYNKPSMLKIIKKINSLKEIVSYVHGDMIYIYGEKIIFGLDLRLISYIGLNSDKIKSKIKEKSDVFLDGPDILIEYKGNVETLGNKVRYIPYLYTIRHGENNTSSFIHIP